MNFVSNLSLYNVLITNMLRENSNRSMPCKQSDSSYYFLPRCFCL